MHEFFLPAATINQRKRYSNILVSIHPFPVCYVPRLFVSPFRHPDDFYDAAGQRTKNRITRKRWPVIAWNWLGR